MMNKNGGDYEECFKPTPLQITGEESHLPCELEIEAENLVAFQVRDFLMVVMVVMMMMMRMMVVM